MKTLDGYIIKNFLTSALSVLVALMLLRVLSDMFFNMDEFVEYGETGKVARGMLSYYGYHVFEYFGQLGGIIIVVAAGFTISWMNHSNELTAMLASGISLHRVIWPIVLCSMLLGGLIIINQEFILPPIAGELIMQRDGSDDREGEGFAVGAITDRNRTVWNIPRFESTTLAGEVVDRMLRPLYLVRDQEELVLLANARSLEWGYPTEVAVRLDDGKAAAVAGWRMTDAVLSRAGGVAYNISPTSKAIYTAIGGRNILDEAKQAVVRAGRPAPADASVNNPPKVTDPAYEMELSADRLEFDHTQAELERTYTIINPQFRFYADTESGRKELGIFVADSAQWVPATTLQPSRWQLTGGALFMPSDLTVDDLHMQESDKQTAYMSTAQLSERLASGKTTDPEGTKLTRNIRFADPVNNLVMLLLGLPFILSRERNIKASVLMCVIMVSAFFAFTFICRYMGIGPFWGAFLPILLFGPIAVVMLDAVKT